MEFVWSGKEDNELLENGITVMWIDGAAQAIQKFVETLSYKIGYKCDWSYFGGRAHIDVPKECFDDVIVIINDDEFMKEFYVPYSETTSCNGTYFGVIKRLTWQ